MYDLDSLVSDGTVRVAASRFPVVVTLGSSGVSPARFALAQVPGSDSSLPESWVAVVWVANQTGGAPVATVAESVARIVMMSVSAMQFVLSSGQILAVTPSRGCGCGNRLRQWRGWPDARLCGVPSPPVTPIDSALM